MTRRPSINSPPIRARRVAGKARSNSTRADVGPVRMGPKVKAPVQARVRKTPQEEGHSVQPSYQQPSPANEDEISPPSDPATSFTENPLATYPSNQFQTGYTTPTPQLSSNQQFQATSTNQYIQSNSSTQQFQPGTLLQATSYAEQVATLLPSPLLANPDPNVQVHTYINPALLSTQNNYLFQNSFSSNDQTFCGSTFASPVHSIYTPPSTPVRTSTPSTYTHQPQPSPTYEPSYGYRPNFEATQDGKTTVSAATNAPGARSNLTPPYDQEIALQPNGNIAISRCFVVAVMEDGQVLVHSDFLGRDGMQAEQQFFDRAKFIKTAGLCPTNKFCSVKYSGMTATSTSSIVISPGIASGAASFIGANSFSSETSSVSTEASQQQTSPGRTSMPPPPTIPQRPALHQKVTSAPEICLGCDKNASPSDQESSLHQAQPTPPPKPMPVSSRRQARRRTGSRRQAPVSPQQLSASNSPKSTPHIAPDTSSDPPLPIRGKTLAPDTWRPPLNLRKTYTPPSETDNDNGNLDVMAPLSDTLSMLIKYEIWLRDISRGACMTLFTGWLPLLKPTFMQAWGSNLEDQVPLRQPRELSSQGGDTRVSMGHSFQTPRLTDTTLIAPRLFHKLAQQEAQALARSSEGRKRRRTEVAEDRGTTELKSSVSKRVMSSSTAAEGAAHSVSVASSPVVATPTMPTTTRTSDVRSSTVNTKSASPVTTEPSRQTPKATSHTAAQRKTSGYGAQWQPQRSLIDPVQCIGTLISSPALGATFSAATEASSTAGEASSPTTKATSAAAEADSKATSATFTTADATYPGVNANCTPAGLDYVPDGTDYTAAGTEYTCHGTGYTATEANYDAADPSYIAVSAGYQQTSSTEWSSQTQMADTNMQAACLRNSTSSLVYDMPVYEVMAPPPQPHGAQFQFSEQVTDWGIQVTNVQGLYGDTIEFVDNSNKKL
ncbi:hypothetical protein S40293_09405 [Stachybotrys chartarum IBT 40293]|nr:hypothetical protein S40293_09405 [Stachybotrys chartarum IBT 40293]